MFYRTHLAALCRQQQLLLPQDTEPGLPHIWHSVQAGTATANSLTREETGTLLNWFIANKQTKLLLHTIWCLFSSFSWLCPMTFVECRPTIEKFIHKSLLVRVLSSFTSLEFVSPGSRANYFPVLKTDGNLHCRILSALTLSTQLFSSSSQNSLNSL